MEKCKYYHEWAWGEPPLEPDENGRLITEYDCKNAEGYFVAGCEGNKEGCCLQRKQAKKQEKWLVDNIAFETPEKLKKALEQAEKD